MSFANIQDLFGKLPGENINMDSKAINAQRSNVKIPVRTPSPRIPFQGINAFGEENSYAPLDITSCQNIRPVVPYTQSALPFTQTNQLKDLNYSRTFSSIVQNDKEQAVSLANINSLPKIQKFGPDGFAPIPTSGGLTIPGIPATTGSPCYSGPAGTMASAEAAFPYYTNVYEFAGSTVTASSPSKVSKESVTVIKPTEAKVEFVSGSEIAKILKNENKELPKLIYGPQCTHSCSTSCTPVCNAYMDRTYKVQYNSYSDVLRDKAIYDAVKKVTEDPRARESNVLSIKVPDGDTFKEVKYIITETESGVKTAIPIAGLS